MFRAEETTPLTQTPLPFLIAAAALLLAAGLALWATALRRRVAKSERERRRTADELNRRLSELFSLQELAYVLSESLQLDRIVEQVVRYAMRFLDARGALLALATEQDSQTRQLHVAAAEGTLAPLKGQSIRGDDPGLVARSLGRERLELVRNSGDAPTELLSGVQAESAAAVPLRAHGVVVGTLVIADPRGGVFNPEDLRLLSTVSNHAAVALANARFFEMVRRAKEQWETAFDALHEGIAVVDEGGRVLRANRSLAQMLDRPVAAVAGEELLPALVGQAAGSAALLDAARRGEQAAALVARSDRLRRTLRLNAARIAGAGPERSVVVLVEDVTDQQAMEAQLIQSEKLAAVGQLVSGVAHELNNPLTSIAGLSEFLLEQQELGPKDRDHLQVIHEQAERAGRIVRNLLTFARKGPGERARVNLNDVVQRTLLLMSYDLKLKDIRTEKNLGSGMPDVVGDRHALQQVVLNLVTNAAHALAGTETGRPRTIRISTWFDQRVRLRVADTGPGIPEDVLPHLFTPFFTTKEPGHGTGLGLSITYSIVEAHGGQITVERPAEGGAAFLVELPPAGPDVPHRHSAEVEAPPLPPAARRTILLVDDDPAVRRMIKALFGREGHTVEVARNPGQALDLARARTYDLILADGQASARGRRFVEELVEARPDLRDRILVATGDVRPTTEVALGQLGLRYVRKPFNLRDLRDEAARVWAAAALS
jgi:two-component system NtrC family sensor kinase